MPGTAYPFVVAILRARISETDRVLEIGCGAMQYRPFLRCAYEGLDLPTSPYIEEPPCYQCSAEDIPCEDARFDLVFGVATFSIIADVDRALAECRRVLRPEGRLVVFDYQKHVCERLHRAHPDHRHVWDFAGLKQRIAGAGFDADRIRDITAEADMRGPLRRALRWLTPWRRRPPPQWLIVEARA